MLNVTPVKAPVVLTPVISQKVSHREIDISIIKEESMEETRIEPKDGETHRITLDHINLQATSILAMLSSLQSISPLVSSLVSPMVYEIFIEINHFRLCLLNVDDKYENTAEELKQL